MIRRPHKRRARAGGRPAALGAILLLLAGACSTARQQAELSGGPGSGAGPGLAATPALAEAWAAPSIRPIGQPKAVGDHLVVYGTEGHDLYLYGVDPADGSVRWRREASPSAVAPGMAVEPRILAGRVAYFRPDPSATLAARLVVADPATGADLVVSGPSVFLSHPGPCADGADVCVRVARPGQPSATLRFSVEGAGPAPDQVAPPPGPAPWARA